ncbi:hypothetical protein H4R20_000202 [Coemansia guatemalensis]|uniref:CHY-type domain-containing protein n=1 Tax=Coemansia guatemalensis TaxID=2761395 RepID=A0A9W8LUC9_9FUNG|nr:hypothetical protein H4R20_000202 [Coemansia guatemalensis]
MAVSVGVDSPSNTISGDQAADAGQSNNTAQTAESRRRPRVCRFFGKGQGCLAGDQCKFIHTQPVPSNQIDETEYTPRSTGRRGGRQGRDGNSRQQARVTVRKTQIDSLLRAPRWTVRRLSAKSGESAFAVEMEPSDPDFPFDVARLYLALVVPAAYPARRTSDPVLEIQVANGNIPSGVKRNIESAFAKNVRKSANAAIESGRPEDAPSLEDHLQWLDRNLELLMQQKPAPTIKFTTFSNAEAPGKEEHGSARRDNLKSPPSPVVSLPVGGVAATRPPVHRPVPRTLQDSVAAAAENDSEDPRRALELRQLERRFRSSYTVISDTASEGTVVRLNIAPTDPDMHSHDIFQITGTISVARSYPRQPTNAALHCSAASLAFDGSSILGRKNKPSTWQPVAGRERQLEHICRQFNEHVQETPETSLLQHLNWLDRHMIGMLADLPPPNYPAPKQTPSQVDTHDAETKEKPSRDTSMAQMFSAESKKPWIRQITTTEAGLPEDIASLMLKATDADSDSDDDVSSTDERPTVDGGEGSATFAKPDRRGIELRFGSVQLSNVALAHCHSLNLSVRCERCKDTVVIRGIAATTRMAADRQQWQACGTCSTVVGVRFRPDWMFDGNTTLGFLDCAGCRPVDMLASKLTLTCDACATGDSALAENTASKQLDTIGTVGIAAHAHFNCRTCYARMTVLLQEPVFERLQNGPAMGGGSGKTQIAKAVERARGAKTRRREELALLGVVPGQPLPDHGSCKHFRRSQRWLRFPCCGKTYPCVSCHDDKEDHPHEYAQSMLCGHCAKEQSVARTEKSGLCIGCGAQVVRKVDGNHAFWQGGTGVRDQTRMSRKEGRKYQGLGKTVSQKNVTTPKK